MRARIAAGVVGFLILAALIGTGVAAAAFAIDTSLSTALGVAGAAAVTSFILLIGPIMVVLIAMLRTPRKSAGEELVGSVLTSVLRSSSLYAILGAGLLGLTETFLKSRKKK